MKNKKFIENIADEALWLLVYVLPILILLIMLIRHSPSEVFALVNNSDFSLIADSVLYQGLFDIFGESGLLPLFSGSVNVYVIYYLTYFISCNIIHLFVDFLLFIPRLAHKWLSYFCNNNKEE